MVKQVDGVSSDLSFDLELTLWTSGGGGDTAAIMVERPNGGETFRPGTTEHIQWMSHGPTSGTVNLEYSPDNGNSWSPIATNVADTGSYNWLVPSVSSSQGLVRISDSAMLEVRDVSDAPFTISSASTYIAIPFGSFWRFDDSNVDPGPAWTSPSFNDSTWREGPGQLGYGNGDEHTVLRKTSPSQPSMYFRKQISVEGPVQAASLKMLFDDGFAVWVNGTLVLSRYVPSTAHSVYANQNSGNNARLEASISASAFVSGVNTIAVMVKQVDGSSSDVSFDLELTLTGP
jgi:hypothetical protein